MRFIDTNIFLRYFTGDDEVKAKDVLSLLKRIDRNQEKAATNLLVIFETIFTLESFYKVKREEIKELLNPILELRGLSLAHKDIISESLDLFCKKNISFADAFNASFMKAFQLKEIYSFDEDFDKIEGIKRLEPSLNNN
ncbi:MAG: PIN domain-containing protein [Desulfobia sp.]